MTIILNEEDKPSLEEALAHYGIRGMKWGVRRGGLTSRLKGHLDDRNQQSTAYLTRARENRPKGLEEKLDRKISVAANLGTKRFNKRADKKLVKLEAQRKRIESGKLKARDILEIAGTVQYANLLISVRDNRG